MYSISEVTAKDVTKLSFLKQIYDRYSYNYKKNNNIAVEKSLNYITPFPLFPYNVKDESLDIKHLV